MGTRQAAALAALLTAVTPVSGMADANFSQYPGFSEHFGAHPRRTEPASPREQSQLVRYRPRLWVGPDEEGPISFYGDYIAQGNLYEGRGTLVSDAVTQDTLNAHRDDPLAVFVHAPASRPVTPVAFGRADREPVLDLGDYTFLTWHFVFRYSGLPAELRWWQSWATVLLGGRADWHQLDHYTAATLALDANDAPVALILQQHNGLRAYWLGADLIFPADGRVRLCAALRSNELYPCPDRNGRHRVVPFMSPETIPFLVTGQRAPLLAAEDITQPALEADYRLQFLPPADAFYSFSGFLGERRRVPGRDGPPGADYFAPPRFLSRAMQLVAFRWRENDSEQMQDMMEFIQDETGPAWSRLAARFRAHLVEHDTWQVPP